MVSEEQGASIHTLTPRALFLWNNIHRERQVLENKNYKQMLRALLRVCLILMALEKRALKKMDKNNQ